MNSKETNRISLVLNVLLAAICVALAFCRSTLKPAAVQTAISQASTAEVDVDTQRGSMRTKEISDRAKPRNWIEVLRDQNVPEKTIARLAMADFDDRWQGRQAAAQDAYNRGDIDSDGLAAVERDHDVEEERDLRAKLGEEAFRRWDRERLFQQFNLRNVNLTPAESDSLYDLATNLRQRLRDLEKERQENQIDQSAYNSAQAKAQSDFESQLRALLGDERCSALRGVDPTVGELRRGLRGVSLDNQQFALLLQAQEQWDSTRAQLEQQLVETGNTNLQQQIDALGAKRDQVFAGILGTNGFALYEKQQDSRYLEMQKNAARWGLDNSTIDYVYTAIEMYEKADVDFKRKVREMQASGVKVDLESMNQPWQAYEREMAQYVRTNLTQAQYDAITQNRILPFAGR